MWLSGRRHSCLSHLVCVALLVAIIHLLWSSAVEYQRVKRHMKKQAFRSPPVETTTTVSISSCPVENPVTSRQWISKGSPQMGDNGPYRVIYNYSPASVRYSGNQSITYCTHITPEYLSRLPALVSSWDGPLSVAVYALSGDVCSLASRLAQLRRCSPEFKQRVSIHLVYDSRFSPAREELVSPDVVSVNCTASDASASAKVSLRSHLKLPYPVNVCRNVARHAARTHFVLSSDVELLPSANTISMFLDLMKRLGDGEERGLSEAGDKKVYVLPVFEVAASVPRDKRALVTMLNARQAVWFHRHVCPHCQRFPGVEQYPTKLYTPGKLKAFTVAARQLPYHRWEPIYIGTDALPMYDEGLSWEGKQDKMTQWAPPEDPGGRQMTELCLLGYRMVVLDQAFLVHAPQPGGIRLRPGFTDPAQSWRLHFMEQNQQVYGRIVRQLASKYRAAKHSRKCLGRLP